jgi:serine phosphatase RsbU (regulator of sigma subunit)
MSTQLGELYQSLEEQVAARTLQLAQANQEISALNNQLQAENLRMSTELDITRRLQKMILPKDSEICAIKELDIAGFMEPADEVGGDYYDVLKSGDRVKIGIGDVTGHGLESGVFMIMAQTAVRTLLEGNFTDAQQFLEVINRTIYDNTARMNCNKEMTMAILDYSQGMFKLSGQHEIVIVVRSNGEFELIDTEELGFPIALVEDIADFVNSTEVHLNPGDVVVLYTDGITEAIDIDNVQYSLERLIEIIRLNYSGSAEEIREAVVDDLKRHIGKQKVYDDITLVVLKQK